MQKQALPKGVQLKKACRPGESALQGAGGARGKLPAKRELGAI